MILSSTASRVASGMSSYLLRHTLSLTAAVVWTSARMKTIRTVAMTIMRCRMQVWRGDWSERNAKVLQKISSLVFGNVGFDIDRSPGFSAQKDNPRGGPCPFMFQVNNRPSCASQTDCILVNIARRSSLRRATGRQSISGRLHEVGLHRSTKLLLRSEFDIPCRAFPLGRAEFFWTMKVRKMIQQITAAAQRPGPRIVPVSDARQNLYCAAQSAAFSFPPRARRERGDWNEVAS
jgi:hypothetical protein